MHFSTLSALSPLDGRYARKLDALRPIMSEWGYMQRRVKVEITWFVALGEAGFSEYPPLGQEARAYLQAVVDEFSEDDAHQIKEIEKTTNHDVKAVEYWIKARCEKLPELESVACLHSCFLIELLIGLRQFLYRVDIGESRRIIENHFGQL